MTNEHQAPVTSSESSSWAGRAVQLAFILALAWILWPAVKGVYYKSVAPPIPAAQTVKWGLQFESGLSSASASGKPVLLVFTASWCPPCKVMKHEVWTDPTVRQLVESNFHPILLDIDLETSHAAADRYQVESIPSIFVLNAKGEVLRRASTMDSEETIAFLQSK